MKMQVMPDQIKDCIIELSLELAEAENDNLMHGGAEKKIESLQNESHELRHALLSQMRPRRVT